MCLAEGVLGKAKVAHDAVKMDELWDPVHRPRRDVGSEGIHGEVSLEATNLDQDVSVTFLVTGEMRPACRPHHLLLVGEVLSELLDEQAGPAAGSRYVFLAHGIGQVSNTALQIPMRAVEPLQSHQHERGQDVRITPTHGCARGSPEPLGAPPRGYSPTWRIAAEFMQN